MYAIRSYYALNLGSSTVGVARVAAEKVTGLLQDMKDLIVSAQQANVDRSKIQAEIDGKVANIATFVSGAQFNGLNLIDGSGTADVSILRNNFV